MSVERLHTLLERMYAGIHFTQITFSCMHELDRTKKHTLLSRPSMFECVNFVFVFPRVNFSEALEAAQPGPQSVNFLQMYSIG